MTLTSFLLFVGIAVMMLVLFIAATYLTARLLCDVAMNRRAPKFMKDRESVLSRITGSEDFVRELSCKGSCLSRENTEQVEIVGYDGIRLRGHLLESKKPKRIIIAVHGWRGSWCRDFGIVSDYFRKDSTVLYVEQRAQQGSEGEYMTFGICERYDVIEWIKWVGKRFSRELPIYLLGISMGASTVLMSTGLGLDDSVHGIIADSGFTGAEEIWSHVMRHNFHLPYRLYKRRASAECKRRTGHSPLECSTLEALKSCTTPILFVHGTDDSFVPVEMTYENYKACKSPKRLFVVPGANHGMSYFVDKTGYESEIERFFFQYD